MADLGQFFTKDIVAQYMVSLFDLPKNANIMDPCFGAGSFLKALASSGFTDVTACEIDAALSNQIKDSYSQFRLLNTDFLQYDGSFDGIVMNPPYIRQEKIDELAEYGITKGKLRSNPLFSDLPSTANMYMYFIIKAIDLLKDGGQLIVIFPSSWMNARTGHSFKKSLLEKCGLEKQVHIYGDVFDKEALVDVVILKMIKRKLDLTTQELYLEAKERELYSISSSKSQDLQIFEYPFSELATIRRGMTTGCNEMYINPDLPCNAQSFFKAILSSPKSITGYSTEKAKLDNLLFPTGDVSSSEVVDYLKYWERKIITDKKPKTLYQRIENDDKWYELREVCGEGILFSYFVRNDMKFILNKTGVLARDNFYVIKSKVDDLVLFALLNNYYTYYQLELNGKRYGAGLLKLQRYDLEKLKFPVYDKISDKDKKEMVRLSRKLLESSDFSIIGEITKIVSKYSDIKHEEIMERYFLAKTSRLEVNTSGDKCC